MSEDAFSDSAGAEVVLESCQSCGRKFNPQTLVKHQKICLKLSSKKRKVFDSTKQRAEALEMTVNQVKQAVSKQISVPKVNWRSQHEDFLNSIRNAKKVSQAIAEGKPLPPPPAPVVNPNYIQCEYCERRFNPTAADRHIKFCKEQHLRMSRKVGNKAANKPKPKPQYEPPKPRVKTESSSAPPRPTHNLNAAAAAAPSRSGNLQERSGLRRPGFTSRLPSAPSNNSAHLTRKLGKDTQKQGYDEQDTNVSNGVNYTGTGPALRTGRGGKSYPDVKSVNSQNRIVGGLSMGRGTGGHINKTVPNSLSKNAANRYGTTQEAESGYHSGSSEIELRQFCHSCNTKYPVVEAKFCCECGVKRLLVR